MVRIFGGPRRYTGSVDREASNKVSPGTQVIPVDVKSQYDPVPFHVYHPTPHDAITILNLKKDPHQWLVAGWYVDAFREGGHVTGLIYRSVQTDQDKEAVLAELKKRDKDANAKFSLG